MARRNIDNVVMIMPKLAKDICSTSAKKSDLLQTIAPALRLISLLLKTLIRIQMNTFNRRLEISKIP